MKEICGVEYRHELLLAPTQDMLDQYKKEKGSWAEYESQFLALLAERRIENAFQQSLFAIPTVLLCSEPTAEQCHRRLVLEYLKAKWRDIQIVHL